MKVLSKVVIAAVLFQSLFLYSQSSKEGLPDLNRQKTSAFIMGPGSATYPIGKPWAQTVKIMATVKIWDKIVDRMEEILCSQEQNRSVLLVGEPSEMYRFIFARLANRGTSGNCKIPDMWHMDVDVNKIESGHSYVGQVEQYWEDFVLGPNENKSSIVYFSDLDFLIGLGSHSGDPNGIEKEYVNNFTSGRLRTVSFIDKYGYNAVLQSRHNYVLHAFAEKIVLPDLDPSLIDELVKSYVNVLYPNLKLTDKVAQNLYRSVKYFMPNRYEPDRTIQTLALMIREVPTGTEYTFKDEDVRNAIMKLVQVPEWMVTRDFTLLKNLKAKLDDDVVGVSSAKSDIVRLAKNGYIAGRTDEKPIATNLFVGPTGTGKSYIAKKFAEFMNMQLITFDMTTYKDPSTFPIFQDTLAKALTNNPYAVYLFEEIDKASIQVLDQLYFMMDEGVFYNSQQRPLFARGAFILMTTNAAQDIIIKEKDNPELKKLVNLELQKVFRMSFLNRFDAVSIFYPFTDSEFVRLATTMLKKKAQKLKENFDWNLTFDQATSNFAGLKGKSPTFGARPMERLIENIISTGIAEYTMQRTPILGGSNVEVKKLASANDFNISVNSGSPLNYSVETDVGGGVPERFLPYDLGKFFEGIRMYND